ncbi:MAG: YbhB/YbcL family Raf kinase inhibitor-like protein [Verrucomicrobiota bacterium]|nr:YbhB/YbcL family Raf kinase inhibitor-like protein [Verrucomicrobiota bacterium]
MMRRSIRLGLAIALSAAACAAMHAADEKLALTSSAFGNGAIIPEQFTCKGANVNPALYFHGIPLEAKALALIVEDPDAPSGLFTHWIVWNIDPTINHVGEKSVPAGAAQGTNDFGNLGYGGPCPPSGTHRYIFRLFALDAPLDLKPGARRAALNQALTGHVLARSEMTARFTAR